MHGGVRSVRGAIADVSPPATTQYEYLELVNRLLLLKSIDELSLRLKVVHFDFII